MHEGQELRHERLVRAHGVSESAARADSEVVLLRVAADQQRQTDVRHQFLERWMPALGEALAGREVAWATLAGVEKVHR